MPAPPDQPADPGPPPLPNTLEIKTGNGANTITIWMIVAPLSPDVPSPPFDPGFKNVKIETGDGVDTVSFLGNFKGHIENEARKYELNTGEGIDTLHVSGGTAMDLLPQLTADLGDSNNIVFFDRLPPRADPPPADPQPPEQPRPESIGCKSALGSLLNHHYRKSA